MTSGLDLDPESLCDRDEVAVQTETRTGTRSEFETARELEHHVTVGITNDDGEVLLVSDGARGWTLPAVPVDPDEDWAAAGRRAITTTTGAEASLDEPVRVRRVEFRQDDHANRVVTTYDVLVRATVTGRPIADEPTLAGDDVADLLWLDRAPEAGTDGVAADVRAVLDRSTA
ncbi:NUDIX hydrolase [Halosolutus halophilus]|uniref:NUDIX hydrolase n=1 Tax=Halosolutus halophilus TaxID=1552990 RepID=UPI002234FAB5|nr:NUDIX domain-containing protein [Halosolutus halophilus]